MVERTVLKKRVGPAGKEIGCKSDAERWVDIKETKKAKYERGTGRDYQKTIYDLCANTTSREYDDKPKITFKNPEDQSQKIEYLKDKGRMHGTTKKKVVEAGTGRDYQKTIVHYCNNEDNETRDVRIQKVENQQTGDYIMVERIKKFSNEWGTGRAFQKKIVHLCNNEDEIRESTGPCKFDGGN
jgi:hypothetical protein